MKERIALISILANVFLAAGKLVAGFLAGSGAVFAEGLHSGMDILSSGISFAGIKIAPDAVERRRAKKQRQYLVEAFDVGYYFRMHGVCDEKQDGQSSRRDGF